MEDEQEASTIANGGEEELRSGGGQETEGASNGHNNCHLLSVSPRTWYFLMPYLISSLCYVCVRDIISNDAVETTDEFGTDLGNAPKVNSKALKHWCFLCSEAELPFNH